MTRERTLDRSSIYDTLSYTLSCGTNARHRRGGAVDIAGTGRQACNSDARAGRGLGNQEAVLSLSRRSDWSIGNVSNLAGSRRSQDGSGRRVTLKDRHRSLHRHPPLTPAGVLLRGRWAAPLVALAFLVLSALAFVDDGAALRGIDERATRALMALRSGPLDGVVKTISALGGLTVAAAVLVLLLLLVWQECRALAWTLLAASAARPLLEWTLKEIVDRSRPDIDRLVAGNGPSFPSGHVMAAIAIWGLLPPVVALLNGRRSAWWWSVAISATVIGSVALSRVYLGVHWLTDVVGALLLGALYLLAVEALLDWHHRRRPCPALDIAEGTSPPRARPSGPVANPT